MISVWDDSVLSTSATTLSALDKKSSAGFFKRRKIVLPGILLELELELEEKKKEDHLQIYKVVQQKRVFLKFEFH